MEKIRVHQRWMALPWGVIGIGLGLIFAAIGVYSLVVYPGEKPGVRAVIPAYALALYWVIAALCNRRTATITPRGVRVIIWPFFVRLPQRVKRENIRHCYLRQVDIYDDGALLEEYYSVGIETLDGEAVEISAPHDTAEEALAVANRIAPLLRVEVRAVEQIPEKREVFWIVMRAGFWLALFIAAIFAGFAWEA